MPRAFFRLFTPLIAGLAVLVVAPAAQAQSPFSAAVYVNDDAITNYEITQKRRFLEYIGAAGSDPRALALERVIEDRLQLQEAERLGGRLTPDQITDGMTEFATRVQLSADEMLAQMRQAGIDRETFVSFIRAGVLWRELVQATYGAQVNITETQIDQALSVEGVQPSTEVLISEIFLPTDPQFAAAVERMVPQVQRIGSETEFANAARQVSVAPTAAAGGRIDRWIDVGAMPEPVGAAMREAPIGRVVGPLEVPGALAFFQLRARREARSVPMSSVEITYYRAGLPGGRSEPNMALVQRMRGQIDQCSDFPGTVLRDLPELPESAVAEVSRIQTQIDAATRGELERLNPGQISANLVQDGDLQVLMLCRRTITGEGVPTRDGVRLALMNRALEGFGMVYLQRLRAEADIRYP